MDSHAVWQGVLGEIEVTVSSSSFTAWFKNTKLEIISEKEVLIIAPNIFARTQLEKRFHPQILEALAHNGINAPSISYNVESSNKKPRVNREVDKSGQQETAKPLILPSRKSHSSNLNPRYTFDNFIVGSSNDLAYAACQAVAAHPGEKYNPLYLYGGSGLGKTHLMQAVGNEIVKKQSSARVLYITTETFVNEFLDSIRFKKKGFSDKYRNVDVLIVDDMQFIAGKEKTQDEFFHTFNELQMNQKQIVLISDRSPSQLNDLEDRLVTRFSQGITADITPPDFETRMAIIKFKCEQFDIKLDEETLTYISSNVSSNIRELEGVLKRIKFTATSKHEQPSLSIAEEILKSAKTSPRKNISPENIINVCADFYKIKIDDILSSSRKKEVVQVRNIAIYLCRELTTLSFPSIGDCFNKDHTSILYSFNKIAKLSKDENPEIFEDIEVIKERLGKI